MKIQIHFFPAKEHTPKDPPASRRRRVLAALLGLVGTVTISAAGIANSETGDHRFRALEFVGLAFSIAGFVLHIRGRKSA